MSGIRGPIRPMPPGVGGPMAPGVVPRPMPAPGGIPAGLPAYKKGGKVKKTGKALVHKGEKVMPKSKAKKPMARARKR